MKCYICKKELQKAHRTFLEARNRREKDKFRDLCDDCDTDHWAKKGYVIQKSTTGGIDELVKLEDNGRTTPSAKKRSGRGELKGSGS